MEPKKYDPMDLYNTLKNLTPEGKARFEEASRELDICYNREVEQVISPLEKFLKVQPRSRKLGHRYRPTTMPNPEQRTRSLRGLSG